VPSRVRIDIQFAFDVQPLPARSQIRTDASKILVPLDYKPSHKYPEEGNRREFPGFYEMACCNIQEAPDSRFSNRAESRG
jgi:hypothetical protein